MDCVCVGVSRGERCQPWLRDVAWIYLNSSELGASRAVVVINFYYDSPLSRNVCFFFVARRPLSQNWWETRGKYLLSDLVFVFSSWFDVCIYIYFRRDKKIASVCACVVRVSAKRCLPKIFTNTCAHVAPFLSPKISRNFCSILCFVRECKQLSARPSKLFSLLLLLPDERDGQTQPEEGIAPFIYRNSTISGVFILNVPLFLAVDSSSRCTVGVDGKCGVWWFDGRALRLEIKFADCI